MAHRNILFTLGRRLNKALLLILILAFLTPVAHWLSKDDFLEEEPSLNKAQFVLPQSVMKHEVNSRNKGVNVHDEGSREVKHVQHEIRAPQPAAEPQQEVHISLTVQLGTFALHDDMISIAGEKQETKGFMTIGIPTVLRKISGAQYLLRTLRSLLDNLDPEEARNVIILVFLADIDVLKRNEIHKHILVTFPEELQSGQIQVMSVNKTAYPTFNGLKRNYDDTDERVKWRAKQVVDFAFMFYYARNLSKYYLHLEDDVIASPYFLSRIKTFVISQRSHWVALDFSMLGFIGKLIRSTDLEEFARFLLMFYDEQPADYLYSLYCKIQVQDRRILHRPTLFQHFGEHSSLGGKSQLSQDRFFALGQDAKLPVFTYIVNSTSNPHAFIITSLASYGSFIPESPYMDTDSYFWGKEPRANDEYLIVFQESQRLSKVSVETGRTNQQNDFLRHGVVEISREKNNTELVKHEKYHNNDDVYVSPEIKELTDRYCSDFKIIGAFDEGKMVADNLEDKFQLDTKCLRIRITQDQEEWLIINDISIKVALDNKENS